MLVPLRLLDHFLFSYIQTSRPIPHASVVPSTLLYALQIYFLPGPLLSSIPFGALETGGRLLIEKAPVAQASSLRALDSARVRWHAICNEPRLPSKVGVGSAVSPMQFPCWRFQFCRHFNKRGKRGGKTESAIAIFVSIYYCRQCCLQALTIRYCNSPEYLEKLNQVLPTETLSGSAATKEKVTERLTSGSAPLIHFLGHETPGGKSDRHCCNI